MTLKEDIKEIKEHVCIINDELGTLGKEVGVIKNELKWHKWLLLVCLVLILALFGINIKMPAPFVASGLSILMYGLR